jgi:hypothetical protein
MSPRHVPWKSVSLVMIGTGIGFLLAGTRPPVLFAAGADRRGESVVMTGPIATEVDSKRSIQITNDAIYYLNYSTGRLFAAFPSPRQSTGGSQILSEFAERDLVKDFDIPPGSEPHYLVAAGTMGILSEGWAPLYVFETTTGQLGIYRVMSQATARSAKPSFLLLEKKSDRRLAEYRAGRSQAAR